MFSHQKPRIKGPYTKGCEEGTIFLQNINNQLPSSPASYPKRMESCNCTPILKNKTSDVHELIIYRKVFETI
jgi:hypothetical protein